MRVRQMTSRAARTAPALVCAAVAGAALFGCASSARAASGWTTAQGFATGKDTEIVPRAGVAADGTGAVAWQTGAGALVVSVRGRQGRFGPARVIDGAGARELSVAAAPGGGFLVAWEDTDAMRVAVRTRSGRAVVVRRVSASTRRRGDVLQVARDPRGGWVVAELRASRVRALSLDRGGRRIGPVQDLGPGHFGTDARQTQALAVDSDGRAVLAFTRGSSVESEWTVVVTTRAHGGIFGEPIALPGPAAEPRVAVGDRGRAVIAVARTDFCAEAYCFGPPGVAPLTGGGGPGEPFGPSLADPGRAFAPTAALTGRDRGVLVFQVKRKGSSQFSPEDPVRAVAFGDDGSVGPLQTLTPAPVSEPAVQALSGGRALALWAGTHRLGAALAGPDGRFHKTAAPAGSPPEPGHINPTNRDLRTAGPYAIFAWEDNGLVRISMRRF